MKTVISNWVGFAANGTSNLSWTSIENDTKHRHVYWNISGQNPAMTYSQKINERMDLWDQVLMNDSISTKNVSIKFLVFSMILTIICPDIFRVIAK